MKMIKIILPIAIIAGAVFVFGFLKSTKPEQQPVEAKERVWRVETALVLPQALSPSLTLYGRVETPQYLRFVAPAAAQVSQLKVLEGEEVAAGAVLLRLDSRDFKPRLSQARADVADIEAQIASETLRFENDQKMLKADREMLKIAESGVARAKRLEKQQLGSVSALDQAKESYERQRQSIFSREYALAEHPVRLQQLQARLTKAKAELSNAELQYARSVMRAKTDLRIAKVSVAVGEQVKANQVLLEAYPRDSLEIRALLPVTYQAEIAQSLAAGGELLVDFAAASTAGHGRLSRLAGEADARGVDALFAPDVQSTALLRLGEAVTLRLQRPEIANAVALPYQALYGNQRIYRLIEGRLQALEITPLGEYQSDSGQRMLLVQSDDLAAGDEVVITHLPNAVSGLSAEVAP